MKNTLQHSFFLSITHTNLKIICTVVLFMNQIKVVDIRRTEICELKRYCFKNKYGLTIIKLNNNLIHSVEEFAFHNLTSLLYIDLSSNQLIVFHKNSIIPSEKLSFVSLENNILNVENSKDALNELTLDFLKIEQFSLCCFALERFKCSARKSWYMSCSDLLHKNSIRYLFYIFSVLIIILNALHLFLQKSKETAEALSYILGFISIVNITSSIPLFILWISDSYFNYDLVLVEEKWKSSIICFISLGINIYYDLASVFLYILLSYARYEVVRNPINSIFKRSGSVLKIIIVGCTFIFLIACFIVVLFWTMKTKAPNRFCSAFFDPSRTFSLVSHLAWFTIANHFIAVFFNLIIYLNLVIEIIRYQKGMNFRSTSRNKSKSTLLGQITCIVSCHLLSWIPSILILFVSQLKKVYPMEMILWQLGCISTLNSILFPFIFIFKEVKTLNNK